ncbi:hypothetical protein D3C84_1216850 [compost metagenome]
MPLGFPRALVVLTIEAQVGISAQGIELREETVETAGRVSRQADLAGGTSKARHELFLLARRITAD